MVRTIERDTPIIPVIVADAVIEEVTLAFPDEANLTCDEQHDVAENLAAYAEQVYVANKRFAKSLRAQGNTGRDQLYVWMRHWFSAWLKENRPTCFRKLPQEFLLGHPLNK